MLADLTKLVHHVMYVFGSMTSQCAQLQLSHPHEQLRSRRESKAKGHRTHEHMLLLLPVHDVRLKVRRVDAMLGKHFYKHQLELLAVALVGGVDDGLGREGLQNVRIVFDN